IFEAFLQERPETLRFNLSRTGAADPEEAERLIADSLQKDGIVLSRLDYPSLLAKAGQSVPEGMLPVVYEAKESGDITRTESFHKGWVTVQDPASAMVAACAAPGADDYIIDVCAAPGGKALALADRLMLLGGRGVVDARDVSAQKVALLDENVQRCGFTNIRTSVRDALKADEDSFYRADVLIADLPCSGIGVIAKKPDIKLNLEAFSIRELQQLQRDILSNISRFVKPRGRLVYSTCTITEEENEQNARWAADRLGFILKSEWKLLPSKDHDGFYIAVLEKRF
ncbi:MAG: methyltransferase domain-containing protein, partial [Oscillospiraceae bacterium]|nr:methyltransferase domain-containing protein [Oscillospiraceae bacterium]